MSIRWNWGTGIAGVYTVFASVTLAFAVVAMSRPVDLVSADYYQRALHEDRRIEATANARALGSGLRLDMEPDSLVIRFAPSLTGRDGTLTMYRPSDASADVQIPLARDAAVQTISLSGWRRGLWIAKLEWSADGRPFYAERPIMLP